LTKEKFMLTKEKIHHTIDSLPDNLTIDQVIDELILLDKIEQGINDVNEGRVFTTDEVKDKLSKWLK
jgi:predicted transcriptional regulator